MINASSLILAEAENMEKLKAKIEEYRELGYTGYGEYFMIHNSYCKIMFKFAEQVEQKETKISEDMMKESMHIMDYKWAQGANIEKLQFEVSRINKDGYITASDIFIFSKTHVQLMVKEIKIEKEKEKEIEKFLYARDYSLSELKEIVGEMERVREKS